MKFPKLKLPSFVSNRINLFPNVRGFDWSFEQNNGDYTLELTTVIPRAGMISLYNFLAKRMNLKFNFVTIEQDFFEIPFDATFNSLMLNRIKPVLMKIQKDLIVEHPTFGFLNWNLAPFQFKRIDSDSYKLTILVAGICNE